MNLPHPVFQVVPELVFVDDDVLTLEIVSWNTRRLEYITRLFHDTEQALLHLQASAPQLLIVDYFMPSMTGLEFLMKANYKGQLENTSIYLCSSVAQEKLPEQFSAPFEVTPLDKHCVCDRKMLTALLDKHLG